MFTILLHSSKTMRASVPGGTPPRFNDKAHELVRYVAGLEPSVIARSMGISSKLANTVLAQMKEWSNDGGSPAIDTFTGDIFSGLQAATLSATEREYAQKCLVILSGLYGILRPLDAVVPYRLEMAYKFPAVPYDNLYRFWGVSIARALPTERTIINTSSIEYTKAVFPYLNGVRIITPKFLTISPKNGQPTFVTVHAKIARGAFARWLIVNRIEDEARLRNFSDLGYVFDADLSTEREPVFVATKFGGLGLSVRLS